MKSSAFQVYDRRSRHLGNSEGVRSSVPKGMEARYTLPSYKPQFHTCRLEHLRATLIPPPV